MYFCGGGVSIVPDHMASEMRTVYCDESCHLECDGQPIMLVGCVWSGKQSIKSLHDELSEIKSRHQASGELKWSKVSRSRENFFLEVVDWFFSKEELHFRCVVVADKDKLDHSVFNRGSHEEFYYKLYYQLLHRILSPDGTYEVYIDLKDTRGRLMLPKLREILCSAKHDFMGAMISQIQNVHSCEIGMVQLADFLLGAVSYRNRKLGANDTKLKVIKKIEELLGRRLTQTSPLSEHKFDVFVFHPREIVGE